MTTQIKHRIVGITVLLFLAIIILPWILGKNQQPVFERQGSPEDAKLSWRESVVKKIPERRPMPDNFAPVVQRPEKPTENLQTLDDSFPAEATQATFSQEISNSVPMEEKQQTTKKMTQIQNEIVRTGPVHKTLELTLPAPISKRLKDVNMTKSLPNKEHLGHALLAKSNDWTVQLGSFSNKVNAEKLIHKLKAGGYPAYLRVTHKNNQTITRAFMGPHHSRESAEKMLKKIEEPFNLKGIIIKVN